MKKFEKRATLNESIRSRQVHLIDEQGKDHGKITREQALDLAATRELDLWQVNTDDVPICKLVDYGKMMYDKAKKAKANKHQHKHVSVKEIRTRYKTDTHDLQRKHKKVAEFIKEGHKVNYRMKIRGRERLMWKEAFIKFNEALEDFADIATWSPPKKDEGKNANIVVVLKPKK